MGIRAITFELPSKLKQFEKECFLGFALESICIPCSIEILCKYCFGGCESLTMLIFEENSQLKRIEKGAFGFSRLRSIHIPENVEFIDGAALTHSNFKSITVDSHNTHMLMIPFWLTLLSHELFDISERLHQFSSRILSLFSVIRVFSPS
jgi:hypothetical protein